MDSATKDIEKTKADVGAEPQRVTVPMFNQDGSEVGQVELKPEVFGVKPNKAVVHQYVVNYLANQRQGNSSSKGRAEVSGGGAKPWRQKGTGRARVGTIRSPLWRTGGIVHGPKPRSYYSRFPKRLKQIATVSALSDRAAHKRVVVLDKVNFDEVKTKSFVAMIDKLNLSGKKILFLEEGKNENVALSARNIPGVTFMRASLLNCYETLKADHIIFTRAGLQKAEEVFS